MEKVVAPTLELLEYVSFKTGCTYLSDLHDPLRWQKIQRILRGIDCHAYDLHEWNDAVSYFTGEPASFTDVEQAASFLQTYKKDWEVLE